MAAAAWWRCSTPLYRGRWWSLWVCSCENWHVLWHKGSARVRQDGTRFGPVTTKTPCAVSNHVAAVASTEKCCDRVVLALGMAAEHVLRHWVLASSVTWEDLYLVLSCVHALYILYQALQNSGHTVASSDAAPQSLKQSDLDKVRKPCAAF